MTGTYVFLKKLVSGISCKCHNFTFIDKYSQSTTMNLPINLKMEHISLLSKNLIIR